MNTIKESELAALAADKTGADVTRHALAYKGECDMPGVLAKARVASNGMISKKWGKNISSVENVTGQPYNKRVKFDNIGSDYSAICTAFGGGAAPVVYNETATYVELYANGSFNIMLIGDN